MPPSTEDITRETRALINPDVGSTSTNVYHQYGTVNSKHVEDLEDHTTWQVEAKICAGYSRSLVFAFLLQYALTLTSVITVGHLGTVELGAVSIANVTANITGYAVYQGLATSLDTLCPQAFGSGRKELVGIHVQRMVYFLWLMTLPIGGLWLASPYILAKIVPDPLVVDLAGRYLRVLLLGAPGYAAFEGGKRFTQAQGIFNATLWVLLIGASLNVLLNWAFVWWLKWGFIGAPIAVSITMTLLPLLLCAYVKLFRGSQCWGGFSKKALLNWAPMVQLSLFGFLMVEAELFAFEILTLLASYFSTTHLAASSIVSNIVLVLWLIPYSMSMGTGTRIATLIGEGKPKSAIVTAKSTTIIAAATGAVSAVILVSLRSQLPKLFTRDAEVIALAAGVLPVCALYQPFDAIGSNCHGILRGQGRQKVGGLVGVICWYVFGLPIAVGAGFWLGWGLHGLWFGVAIALGSVALLEGLAIYHTSWKAVVQRAKETSRKG